MQQSLERQRQLNAYESKHGGTAVYGVNKFSDLTPQEFKGNSWWNNNFNPPLSGRGEVHDGVVVYT